MEGKTLFLFRFYISSLEAGPGSERPGSEYTGILKWTNMGEKTTETDGSQELELESQSYIMIMTF